MNIVFLTLIFLTAPVFANILDDKNTEAEGPGRCPYCDEHTARIDDRNIETNPNALTLLHLAQSAEGEAKSEKKKESAKGVQ